MHSHWKTFFIAQQQKKSLEVTSSRFVSVVFRPSWNSRTVVTPPPPARPPSHSIDYEQAVIVKDGVLTFENESHCSDNYSNPVVSDVFILLSQLQVFREKRKMKKKIVPQLQCQPS